MGEEKQKDAPKSVVEIAEGAILRVESQLTQIEREALATVINIARENAKQPPETSTDECAGMAATLGRRSNIIDDNR